MSTVAAAQWLVVVRRDRPEVHDRLRRAFAGSHLVEVILDRRLGERRAGSAPGDPERRRGDRRRAPGERGAVAGYRRIQSADGFEVFQSDARVIAPCPECGAAVEFEMPRLAELPARLEVDVVHARGAASATQHVVEAQAFRVSGRPFLACRLLARRRAAAG
jgi:hypothetical protein